MKRIYGVILTFVFLLVLASCGGKEGVVSVDKINVGQEQKIVLENLEVADVTFSSDNENFVVVDDKGNLLGLSPGVTTIRVKKDKKEWSFTITVEGEAIVVELEGEDFLELNTGKKYQLEASTNDSKGLIYESSKENVATVSQDGEITAIKAGQTKITVSSKINKNVFKTVTVEVIEGLYINVVSKLDLRIGETHKIVYETNEQRGLSFDSSDKSVAIVDVFGEVKAVKAGVTIITITSRTDATVQEEIEVKVFSEEEILFEEAITNTNNLTNYTLEFDIMELANKENFFHTIIYKFADDKKQLNINGVDEYFVKENDKQYRYYLHEGEYVKEEVEKTEEVFVLMYENLKFSDFDYVAGKFRLKVGSHNVLDDFLNVFPNAENIFNFQVTLKDGYIETVFFNLYVGDSVFEMTITIKDGNQTVVEVPNNA